MKKSSPILRALFAKELELLDQALSRNERWEHLERLHILGQNVLKFHFQVHFLMLRQAKADKNLAEIVGQISRILLVVPGQVFGLLPRGNVGSSRVSAFQKMQIPPDILKAFED